MMDSVQYSVYEIAYKMNPFQRERSETDSVGLYC